jgi:sensor domain CHASE-containing protein
MLYVLSFLSVAAVPLAVAGYGGHLAAKVLDRPERRKALRVVWLLAAFGVLISGVQQVMVYRADRDHEQEQTALRVQAQKDQQELREKLDSSLRHEEDVRRELGSIVQFLRTPQPQMDMRNLADAASRMVEDAMHR